MATYPSAVKNFTSPTSASYQDDAGVLHDVQHSEANEEIQAVETELGATPKSPTLTAPASSASDVAELLGMVLQQLENISGETNWYDAIGTDLSTDVAALATHSALTTAHGSNGAVAGKSDKLSAFAATTSAELAGVLSDETGSGKAVFDTSPAITTPTLTSPTISVTWDAWVAVTDSWSYASADAPNFVITAPAGAASIYSAGMRIKLTQTTVKYFIITAVTDTTLTIYGGTDYTLVDAAISAISYSSSKAPLGFPLDPLKWTVQTTNTGDNAQTNPTSGTWYNLGSVNIIVPIGVWKVSYEVALNVDASAAGVILYSTLSTANNSESDTHFTTYEESVDLNLIRSYTVFREKFLNLASKTTYYLNTRQNGTSFAIRNFGGRAPTIIRAVCAYL